MGRLDLNPGDQQNSAFEQDLSAIQATDDVADSDRTPAMPSVIEVTPQPSAVDTGEARTASWIKSLGAKIGIAAIAVIGATTAVTSVNGSRTAANSTEIRPDNAVEARKTYKNLAVPMMSKDGKKYQMTGTYEKDFNLDIVSPENPTEHITVKVSPEGKYEIKGNFEKPASQVEFKPSTLDGKEIAFTSYEEVMKYISQNPESPKPIVGTQTLHSMQGMKPTRTEVYSKNLE